MCLVGRAFVLMGSFSSVLVRSIFLGGAFVWSWSALNAGQMCGLFFGGRLWIALVYV